MLLLNRDQNDLPNIYSIYMEDNNNICTLNTLRPAEPIQWVIFNLGEQPTSPIYLHNYWMVSTEQQVQVMNLLIKIQEENLWCWVKHIHCHTLYPRGGGHSLFESQ